MILTRRTALCLSLSALAAPLLVRPARAACQPADLGRGISFTRKDGSQGLARRDGDGTVVIDYVLNRGSAFDRRRVKHGVFEVSRMVETSELPVVGASAPEYTWTYSPKPKALADGTSWEGRRKEVREVIISDADATVKRQRSSWTASYHCFEPREVKLSGCSYRVLTVEAGFSGDAGNMSQRWVFFPQLGLGLETRRDGVLNGLVTLVPV